MNPVKFTIAVLVVIGVVFRFSIQTNAALLSYVRIKIQDNRFTSDSKIFQIGYVVVIINSSKETYHVKVINQKGEIFDRPMELRPDQSFNFVIDQPGNWTLRESESKIVDRVLDVRNADDDAAYITIFDKAILRIWNMIGSIGLLFPEKNSESKRVINSATIQIYNDAFIPSQARIKKGSMVIFENLDNTLHRPSTSDDYKHDPLLRFDSEQYIMPGRTWGQVFDKVGTYPYQDQVNSKLEGVIFIYD